MRALCLGNGPPSSKDVLYWIDDDKKEIIPNIDIGRVKSIIIPAFAQQSYNNQNVVHAKDTILFYKAFTEFHMPGLGPHYKIYRVAQQQMPQRGSQIPPGDS